ncbi:uncharacterized protein LOC142340778 [Convolutriloba macropyga]|uniref:uncharacterized protein LOC142340778 n=1 Tax=Convolutriloba macropyga TaxID=536237 RepID=UPI003F51CA13
MVSAVMCVSFALFGVSLGYRGTPLLPGEWMKVDPESIHSSYEEMEDSLLHANLVGDQLRMQGCQPWEHFLEGEWFNIINPDANEIVIQIYCAGRVQWVFIAGIPRHTADVYTVNPMIA